MRHYYATSSGNLIDQDIYEGGFLRYEAGSQPYLNLWTFSSKLERDVFVNELASHDSITLKEIMENSHLKEQLGAKRLNRLTKRR